MSGKYNENNDFKIHRILEKEEKTDIIFYKEDCEITNDIWCIVVKKGLSKKNAFREAEKVIKNGGFKNKIKSIKKGRLDYDDYEEGWSFDNGTDIKSEIVWIILTD